MKPVMIALVASLTVVAPSAALAQTPAKVVVLASDIPVARTPPGFWKTFPAPVLARCTEPLAPGAPDLRGVWTGDNDGKTHVERIQQCGDRVVIEGGGVTHDMRADGILAHGVDDIATGTARPIKVAIVPEVPGGKSHPAQAAAVRQAGKHLQAAGYVVEEMLPPDIERGVELWHEICVTDVIGGLWPTMQKMGDPDGIAAMRGWLDIHKPVDLATYVAALTERESLLFRWMTFFQQWPLVILPTLSDLPPKQVADITRDGQATVLDAMRPALLAPLLGLPGLAVPVGSHGKLRTGVQIMAMRNREDLCLDAGEVIEAAEGIVTPIDPS